MSKIFSHTDSLPKYTSLGCYPLLYLVEYENGYTEVLCAVCATKAKREIHDRDVYPRARTITPDVHWEGEPEICNGCSEEIQSAYGAPESETFFSHGN